MQAALRYAQTPVQMLLEEHIAQGVTIMAQSDHEFDHSISTKCAFHLYVLICN